eukprot:CAMPEP_0197024358 /NCGR_PEP_ID=MMETSP1384-20130603/4909_1 /TAXON_ID=29189 /ORGANISM="Ammonia sp." /LENGTH=547 /DNA_ID=CAMNT_0042452727 /DNA_START=28 /DNA_END=1671 /DNA_ORIENTATION=+
MKLKIVWNDDVRIFYTQKDKGWNEILPDIRTFVREAWGIDQFNMTYVDEEDERITITRTSDLEDALTRYKHLEKIPRLHIALQPSGALKMMPDGDDVEGPRLGYGSVGWLHRKKEAASAQPSEKSEQWVVEPSQPSMSTVNKIRQVVDQIDMTAIPRDKEFISIAIGDPTKYPNLLPSSNMIKEVQNELISQHANGYSVSYGVRNARIAISKKYSLPHIHCSEEDVIIGSGCSDALNMSVCALLNEGDNFLIPRPGFSFYETLASRYGFKVKYYNLLHHKEWEIDTEHMRSLIDQRTKAILVNNPSNPCGSVLKEENIMNVLKVAEDYSIPIISDEIYAGMIYDDNNGQDRFYSVASLTKRVPVLTLGGLSKLYLVPGWRVGWIVMHDPIGALNKVRTALQKLSTVLLGANTMIQSAIPSILCETPDKYYEELNDKLHRQSSLLYNEFNDIEALQPIRARGAMYLMVKIDVERFNGKIKNDIDFANLLLKEQGVLCLPGTIFNMPNYFRAVICPPPRIIAEIGKRVREFCRKYSSDDDEKTNLTAKL